MQSYLFSISPTLASRQPPGIFLNADRLNIHAGRCPHHSVDLIQVSNNHATNCQLVRAGCEDTNVPRAIPRRHSARGMKLVLVHRDKKILLTDGKNRQTCTFQRRLISKPSLLHAACHATSHPKAERQSEPSSFWNLVSPCPCQGSGPRLARGSGVLAFAYAHYSEHDEG